jgi:predicted nucleic acid-binding protein
VPTATVVKVVDASALAAMLFGEPEAEAVASRLENARLTAPALLPFELANAYATKMRSNKSLRGKGDAVLRLVYQLAIETADVDIGGVIDLAEATGLTAYDASYLWLARSLAGELVTLDRQLAKAAGALGA